MTTASSRRAFLTAFGQSLHQPEHDVPPDGPMIAVIGEACVEPKGVMCRRCGDECGENAIRFKLMTVGRAQVLVDGGLCTGCAECLAVCPVNAISLQPVSVEAST